MERIAEVTETMSSSSETGSVPQTEVEVLEFKEEVMSPRQDKEDVWKEQSEHPVDNSEYSKKNIESMQHTITQKRSKNKDREHVELDQQSMRTDRKPGDNPKYSEHDTENMQSTMTLKRNKKEKKKETEHHLDQLSRKDHKKTTDNSQYTAPEPEKLRKSRKKKEGFLGCSLGNWVNFSF